LAANPIGLVVTLIAALIGVLVTAYNKSDAFRNIVDSLARVLGGALKTAINFVTNAFDSFIDAIKSAWNWIGNLIDKIGNLLSKLNPLKALGNVLGGIGGKADAVRSGNQLARTGRADRAGGTTGSGGVPVMVSDEQLARAITSLLLRSGVRNGARPGYVL
jgi:phage-related minor tail protein